MYVCCLLSIVLKKLCHKLRYELRNKLHALLTMMTHILYRILGHYNVRQLVREKMVYGVNKRNSFYKAFLII